jgi:hypothetical protein
VGHGKLSKAFSLKPHLSILCVLSAFNNASILKQKVGSPLALFQLQALKNQSAVLEVFLFELRLKSKGSPPLPFSFANHLRRKVWHK